MKRIISAILTLCLAFSVCTVGFSASAAAPKKVTTLTEAAAKQHFKRLYDYIDKNGAKDVSTFKSVKGSVKKSVVDKIDVTETVYFRIMSESKIILQYEYSSRTVYDSIELIVDCNSNDVRTTYSDKRWNDKQTFNPDTVKMEYFMWETGTAIATLGKDYNSNTEITLSSCSSVAFDDDSMALSFNLVLSTGLTMIDAALDNTLSLGVNHLGFYDYDGSIYCVPAKGHHYGDRDYAGGSKATFTKDGSTGNLQCHNCATVVDKAQKIAKVSNVSLSATKYTYDGKVKTPAVTVKDSAGKALKKGTDYTVSYAAGRTNVGKYAVTVTLKGNYSGTKTLYFNIAAKSASSISAKLSTTKYSYNGKAKKPSIIVKANGKTLKKGTDYTVSYAKGRKNVGKYAVTITYKGNYSGKKTLYFTIVPKATKLKTVSAGSKKLTVKWSKQSSQTSGYEIQYSTSKKFKGAKTVKISKNKTTSATVKKLKAGKKYYVRVRTYKTVGGKKYYSAWSNAKNKTTKK